MSCVFPSGSLKHKTLFPCICFHKVLEICDFKPFARHLYRHKLKEKSLLTTESYYMYAILSFVCPRDFFLMFQTFPEMSIQDNVIPKELRFCQIKGKKRYYSLFEKEHNLSVTSQ